MPMVFHYTRYGEMACRK